MTVSQGYFVNLLRVRKSGILSRHRHTGPVHATVLRGRWHYLEHPWWAEEGSYAMEPPGDIHTLEVPDGVDEMVTMLSVNNNPSNNAQPLTRRFLVMLLARTSTLRKREKLLRWRTYLASWIRRGSILRRWGWVLVLLTSLFDELEG